MEKYVFQLARMTWATAAVWSVGLAVGYYFLMYDNGNSVEQRIAAAQTQKAELEKVVAETEANIRNSEKFENDVKIALGQFEKVIEYMPKEMNMAELTALISTAATTSEAKIIKMEPQSSANGSIGEEAAGKAKFYETTKIDLTLEGSFSELVSFLSQLTKVPRLLTFDSIDLTALPDSQSDRPKLALSASLLGYKYVERPLEPVASMGQEGQEGQNAEAH